MSGSHGEHILSFGKYGLGSPDERVLAAVPNSYIAWLLEQDWFENKADFDEVYDEGEWRKSQNVYVED